MGVAISRASSDEYSVPQMKGRAPNSPDTGSHVSVIQNLNPKVWMEIADSRKSSIPIAATIARSRTANAPVNRRNPQSPAPVVSFISPLQSNPTLLQLDERQLREFLLDDA